MNTPKNFHLFYQLEPKTPWIVAPATDRDRILREVAPELISALDCDNDFSVEMTSEEQKAVCYTGDFYADFDGDLAEVLPQVRKFSTNLQDKDVNLSQCSFALTGGRGAHITVPQACFMSVVPQEGIAGLPAAYKELAFSIYCDTLDTRVYTAKRGRLWRPFNHQRDNGNYKVAITQDELRAVTPESYMDLCSSPRPLITPEPPTLAKGLAALFSEARNKVAVTATRKRDSGKTAASLQSRFVSRGAALPVSLLGLGAGMTPAREGVGFNDIALQLCITAVAMGTDEDTLVSLCSGLIAGHQGDGNKYNTPYKRENALREKYHHVDGSNYEVSIGGIRSILPADELCNDLKGL